MLLSLIIPVFNNAPLIGPFVERLSVLVREWPFNCEIIFVDDASTDSTPSPISSPPSRERGEACLPAGRGEGILFRLIRLERNAGQCQAIIEGLKHASGDLALTFPVDMKENLPDIPAIVSEFRKRGAAAMQIVRKNRKYPSAFRKIGSLAFNIFSKSLGLNISDIGSSLYIGKKAYHQILTRPEYNRFHKTLPVLIWKLSGRIPVYPLTDRSVRAPSSYPVRKLAGFAWNVICLALTPLPKSSEHPRNPIDQIQK